jgi:hypothetical protein
VPDPERRGRRALAECGEAPVIRGFIPLGEFLRSTGSTEGGDFRTERAAGYLDRLQMGHVDIAPFVANALGLRPPPGGAVQVECS